jgi:hypothetical protein
MGGRGIPHGLLGSNTVNINFAGVFLLLPLLNPRICKNYLYTLPVSPNDSSLRFPLDRSGGA